MNIKRGLFRLALVLSTAWTGGWLIASFAQGSFNEPSLWIGLGGGLFIWVCYWVVIGFVKDKPDDVGGGKS